MRSTQHYQHLLTSVSQNKKLLAILIDPEKFDVSQAASFLDTIPKDTTHLFVGGSTVPEALTEKVVGKLKQYSSLPIFIFPGAADQISDTADALLFLSLVSGDNPNYLIGQQVAAASYLKVLPLEVIATGYLLIDGGNKSAVARVTNTLPMPQKNVDAIVNTALAAQFMGAKLVYLEAGSGAKIPVAIHIIKEVSKTLDIPVIVGGGIRTDVQKEAAYAAGASMVVMGTVFEKH